MIKANTHIFNIKRLLKEVKSKISVNFICSNNKGVLITTNKVAVAFNLNIIEKYMKNLNKVNFSDIISPRLLQYKFYLKILGITYFIEDINLTIFSDIIKSIIKSIYVFNDIVLASCLYIIKASLKLDMIVI